MHNWFTLLEEGKEISAVFFELTKAFDSVPHRQLIAKLEAIGLNAYLINWIKNYLTMNSDCGAKWSLFTATTSTVQSATRFCLWSPIISFIHQ